VLEAQEIKETGNEEEQRCGSEAGREYLRAEKSLDAIFGGAHPSNNTKGEAAKVAAMQKWASPPSHGRRLHSEPNQ